MNEKLFLDKEPEPTDELIQSAIGNTFQYLLQLREFVAAEIGTTRDEWKYYGKKYGYTLKTFLKRRNLFFTTFHEGHFRITFVFGERTEAAIMDSDVDDSLKTELAEARKYAEGKLLALDVFDEKPLQEIKKLIALKVEN